MSCSYSIKKEKGYKIKSRRIHRLFRFHFAYFYVFFGIGLVSMMILAPSAIGSINNEPQQTATNMDIDNDGLLYDDEILVGMYPDNPDSDGDSIRDGVDPDILCIIIKHLPIKAFKSSGEGHRTAILKQLRNNERYILEGNIEKAIQNLKQLRKHMDGCPSFPDKDDWIVDCKSQERARRFLDILLANHASYEIDTDIGPQVAVLPGLNGGPERRVGVAVGTEGILEPFVVNEVIFRPESPADLETFLNNYDGMVLRDGTATLLPDSDPPPPDLPDSTGWYLIRVDSGLSPLDDLAENMERGGIRGHWLFSSEETARTASLVAREYEREITLNFTMELAQTPVKEHPDDAGGNLDARTWPWMTEDDDPNQPGEQGLSVGVIHAWEYVRYKGYPPTDTSYSPVKVAIIDAGFDLDEYTGEPLFGADDFPFTIPQLDMVGNDWTAGGAGYGFPNCNGCWHGHLSYGVCCALSQNWYGTAGTSGGWEIKPLLIKVTGDIDTVTNAIYNAIYNSADVIHDSAGFDCGWWCKNFGGGNALKAVVKSAKNYDTIFVTPANNHGKDISDRDQMPCNLDGSVCVGAVGQDGNATGYSNWGTIVDTWAPTDILSTVTRVSSGRDTNDVGIDELHQFGGTSASGPYLAGIVALMKMVNPLLSYEEVKTILVTTANPSNDPKVIDHGYVDAYRAVKAASPNLPPTVQIIEPENSASEQYSNVFFRAQVTDPETPSLAWISADFSSIVEFTSNIDGILCTATGDATNGGTMLSCEASELSLGEHVITAKVTDPFGGKGEDSINIEVINKPPWVKITYPPDGSTYYTNQQINLRGYAFDEEVYGKIPVSWTSNIDGTIGTSEDFWVSLSEGDHTITLTATDEKAESATDSITLYVQSASGDGYPAVEIVEPTNNALFGPDDTITFTGRATDPEDGEISADAAFKWYSNIDGSLGTGKTYQTSDLYFSPESTTHTITLEVTDSDGNKSTHSINVTIFHPM